MLYLASYDLSKPGRDYSDLTAALKKLGGVRVLESEWALTSGLSATDLCNHIFSAGKMDANDRLLVCELTGNTAWRNLLVSDKDGVAAFSRR